MSHNRNYRKVETIEHPKKASEWRGLIVEARYPLKNKEFSWPPGSRWIVLRKYGQLSLKSEPCLECGVQKYIYRVNIHDVKIVARAKSLADWNVDELEWGYL